VKALPAILAFALGTSATILLLSARWVPALQPLAGAGMLLSLVGMVFSFLALCYEPRSSPTGHWVCQYRAILLSLAFSSWPWVHIAWFIWAFRIV
jgi:hypothetical protein